MRLVVFIIGHGALALLFAGHLPAQEPYAPPRAHPVERYQQGWRKNPFALKTAPAVQEEVSFARDLVIAGYFGAAEDPSVVIVNTKTRERMLLKKSVTASNGMILHSITFTDSRKETMAEVTLNGATAVLRFDDSRGRQVAAVKPTRAMAVDPAAQPMDTASQTSGPEPVASMPNDQGSGYPYTYGKPDEGSEVADVDRSPAQGRRGLFKAP
jgi:hypothetical protein